MKTLKPAFIFKKIVKSWIENEKIKKNLCLFLKVDLFWPFSDVILVSYLNMLYIMVNIFSWYLIYSYLITV